MNIYVWLGHFAVQYKLTGHCKSTIMWEKEYILYVLYIYIYMLYIHISMTGLLCYTVEIDSTLQIKYNGKIKIK